MNVHIYVDGSGHAEYKACQIERLSTCLDDMAAVAWDRDMPDVELVVAELGALRFFVRSRPRKAVAFTGGYGAAVAYWDDAKKRWSPGNPPREYWSENAWKASLSNENPL